jgi:hypothetical protein
VLTGDALGGRHTTYSAGCVDVSVLTVNEQRANNPS